MTLERIEHKVFASEAPLDEMGQFGSALATTKLNTKDVAEIQALPAYTKGWGSAIISENNYPAMEEMNGVLNVMSYHTGYLYQEGIPTYSATQEYSVTSWVKDLAGEKVYKSLQGGNKGHDLTDSAWWEELKLGGGGLEIGDIGFTQMDIDESKGKRRKLNGQLIIQDQYVQFTNIIKNSVALNPDLACTESEWQTAVTLNTFGLCGKFVIDDKGGTIRLPKYPNFFIAGLANIAPVVGNGMSLGLTNGTKNYGLRLTGNTENQYAVLQSAYGQYLPYNNSGTSGIARSGDSFGITTDPTKSGIEAQIKQEQIKGAYFIQVATGAETEDNIINEIELNNPFFFGMSQYFDIEPNNISWLKSAGQWNSKALYPSYYDWILSNVNNGVEGFIGNTMYMWGSASGGYMCQTLTPKVGSPIWGYDSKAKVGYVTKVYDTGELDFTDNEHNVSYTKIGRYSPSDESSNAYITDYDFVLNTADETFRLPLLDGSESLLSEKKINIKGQITQTGQSFIAPANGWYYLQVNSGGYADIYNGTKGSGELTANGNSNASRAFTFVSAGDEVRYYYNGTISTAYFMFAQGNGSLYFYVGETVQNANLINAGRIEEKLVDIQSELVDVRNEKLDKSVVKAYITQTYVNGTSWYRVYSDGWCEQGGRTPAQESTKYEVTLLKAFKNTDYTVTVADRYTSNTNNGWGHAHSYTTTSFKIAQAAQGCSWRACGYIV